MWEFLQREKYCYGTGGSGEPCPKRTCHIKKKVHVKRHGLQDWDREGTCLHLVLLQFDRTNGILVRCHALVIMRLWLKNQA